MQIEYFGATNKKDMVNRLIIFKSDLMSRQRVGKYHTSIIRVTAKPPDMVPGRLEGGIYGTNVDHITWKIHTIPFQLQHKLQGFDVN